MPRRVEQEAATSSARAATISELGGHVLAQRLEGAQQHGQALALDRLADEDDPQRAAGPARGRAGAAGDLDAVGDTGSGRRRSAAPVQARRLGHGDPDGSLFQPPARRPAGRRRRSGRVLGVQWKVPTSGTPPDVEDVPADRPGRPARGRGRRRSRPPRSSRRSVATAYGVRARFDTAPLAGSRPCARGGPGSRAAGGPAAGRRGAGGRTARRPGHTGPARGRRGRGEELLGQRLDVAGHAPRVRPRIGRHQRDAHCAGFTGRRLCAETRRAAQVYAVATRAERGRPRSSSGPESLDSDPGTPRPALPPSAARHASRPGRSSRSRP